MLTVEKKNPVSRLVDLTWGTGVTSPPPLVTQALLESGVRRRIRYEARGEDPEKRVLDDVIGGLVGGIAIV